MPQWRIVGPNIEYFDESCQSWFYFDPQRNGFVYPELRQFFPRRNPRASPANHVAQNAVTSSMNNVIEQLQGFQLAPGLSAAAPVDEELFEGFQVHLRPRRFFAPGRKVFLVLWAEPAGSTQNSTSTVTVRSPRIEITRGRFGESVHSKIRRFVVIREGYNFCSALPITTYNGRGVGKPGVQKWEHAIIFTGRQAPPILGIERPERGEEGMRPTAIRVDADVKGDRLDPISRLDFAKIHTIHHNLKVKNFGMVNRGSLQALVTQFSYVWSRGMLMQPGVGSSP